MRGMNMGSRRWSPADVLVTVKAYPQLSQKHGEVVCVAGVRVDTPDPTWIRLFPIDMRDLPWALRFKKYQLVRMRVRRASSDARFESYNLDQDSIQPGATITTGNGNWAKRWTYLEPHADRTTMCELLEDQRVGQGAAASLAMIRPASVKDVLIERNADLSAEKQALADASAEANLFGAARTPLEPAPFTLKYRYECETSGCHGHAQTMIDWEVGEAGRKFLRIYGPDAAMHKLREKFLDEICGADRETHFFVGNQHQHPQSYLVLGAFWPRYGGRPGASLF
jgi:hypothetical protein